MLLLLPVLFLLVLFTQLLLLSVTQREVFGHPSEALARELHLLRKWGKRGRGRRKKNPFKHDYMAMVYLFSPFHPVQVKRRVKDISSGIKWSQELTVGLTVN